MHNKAGSKFTNDVLMSKRGGAHAFKKGHKKANRSKQKSSFSREMRVS